MSLTHELSPAIESQITEARTWTVDPGQYEPRLIDHPDLESALDAAIGAADAGDPDPIQLRSLPFGDEEVFALINTDTGEIIDIPDMPKFADGTMATPEGVDRFAKRLLRAMGRLKANEAGKVAFVAHWAKVAELEYDAKIKQDKSLIEWLKSTHLASVELFAKAAIARQKGKKKSVVVSGLTMSLSQIGGGVGVINEAAAIAWAKDWCPDAVKVQESILKTPLDNELGKTYEFPEGSGLVRVPKADKFEVS